jgi:hypothetical protein
MEPLPDSADDPTRRAIQSAREATANDTAFEDATKKVIRAAKQEALEAETAEKEAKENKKDTQSK